RASWASSCPKMAAGWTWRGCSVPSREGSPVSSSRSASSSSTNCRATPWARFRRTYCANASLPSSRPARREARPQRHSDRRAGSLGVLLSTFAAQALECDPVAALELQHGARLVRRGDFKAQPLDQGAHLRHLLRIAFRKLAGADPQRILQSHPHIAAHCRGHGCDSHLVAPGAQHGPCVAVAEKAVGRALHHHHVLSMGANAAQYAEYALDEERRFHQTAVHEMGQRVKMADGIALDLETGAVFRAGGQDGLDVRERVLENPVP